MDSKDSDVVKMDQKKRINISKIDKIFKVRRLFWCGYCFFCLKILMPLAVDIIIIISKFLAQDNDFPAF